MYSLGRLCLCVTREQERKVISYSFILHAAADTAAALREPYGSIRRPKEEAGGNRKWMLSAVVPMATLVRGVTQDPPTPRPFVMVLCVLKKALTERFNVVQ